MNNLNKIIVGLVILLAGTIIIAQGIGLGGAGGTLGNISLTPQVSNHYWKTCPVGGNLTIDYEILELNDTEEWFKYDADLTFDYGSSTCVATIGKTRVDYDTNRGLTARTALVNSLRARFNEEYNKNFTSTNSLGVRGNYTQ